MVLFRIYNRAAVFPFNSVRKTLLDHCYVHGCDPSELHVVELKHCLKCRGANTTGRKPELVKW